MELKGRELKKLLERAIDALERNATATENMLAIAEQEQLVMTEPGPPSCPHCGKLNPEVTQIRQEGHGPLGDFVMAAETHCCHKVLYAVPIGFDAVPNLELARDILNQRGAGS